MTTLDVKGMTCGHCVNAVTKAVHEIDSQAKVQVDLAGAKVEVDSTMPPERLERAIADAGYEAKARPA